MHIIKDAIGEERLYLIDRPCHSCHFAVNYLHQHTFSRFLTSQKEPNKDK